MTDQIILTPEGKKKLEEELLELKNVKRKEITERIELAKEHGDLSENAEYQEARNEQSFVEGRIMEIENTLKHAMVARTSASGEVQVGSRVVLEAGGIKNTFSIVGSQEGDPTQGLISCDSPIGQAVLGKKVGEQAEVKTPKGLVNYLVKLIE